MYCTSNNTNAATRVAFSQQFCSNSTSWCVVIQNSTWTKIDYILITNLMHWLLFIHKVIFSSKCFEPQVLIFRRIQFYTCSIWYCHSLWEFLVTCRYTAWVRIHSLKLCTDRTPGTLIESDSTIECVQLYPPEDEHLRLETCTGE